MVVKFRLLSAPEAEIEIIRTRVGMARPGMNILEQEEGEDVVPTSIVTQPRYPVVAPPALTNVAVLI